MSMHSFSGNAPRANRRLGAGRNAGLHPTARPARVIVTPVDPPSHHPLSKRDVQRVLSVLPAGSTEGLRSVSLLGDMRTADGYPVLVTYRKHGFIRLHALSARPWSIGPLRATQVADLLRYGARVDASHQETRITWTPEALKLYVTICALMPGVSRHRREREGLTEPGVIVRALDDATEPWLVSDLALHQWGAFLQDRAGESRRMNAGA
ncbi:hypothetical protein KKG45_11665 [bacterium]|nr:hypothetical protein [bacterium]MBU1073893.1 hypothetical protein [bacterium]MBU1675922.1 hypothetical protein [bacterium]